MYLAAAGLMVLWPNMSAGIQPGCAVTVPTTTAAWPGSDERQTMLPRGSVEVPRLAVVTVTASYAAAELASIMLPNTWTKNRFSECS